MNFSNNLSLNAAKFQGYSFYRFWVIKGKPRPGKNYTHQPPTSPNIQTHTHTHTHTHTQIRIKTTKRATEERTEPFKDNKNLISVWPSSGRTVQLPKTKDITDEKNCHPITCLNTTYKLLTGLLGKYMRED